MRAKSLLFVLALLVAGPAGAQTTTYKVEMLFFINTEDTEAFHSEKWPLEPEMPELVTSLDLFGGQRQSGFRALGEGYKDLKQAKKLLESSERYQVIKHVAWRQPGLDAESALPIRIHGGADFSALYPERMQPGWTVNEQGMPVEVPPPPGLEQLDGTIKLVLARYLHVYTDLLLRKPVVYEVLNTETEEVTKRPALMDIRVQEHRRMRSRELHYIDHPLLGMLVQITPME